jgi:hypothetical protein
MLVARGCSSTWVPDIGVASGYSLLAIDLNNAIMCPTEFSLACEGLRYFHFFTPETREKSLLNEYL